MDASSIALVFEGGGTRNSYVAPLVQRLIAEDITVGWVGGISAGATLAAAYLTGNPARAREAFVEAVVDPRAGGIRSFFSGRGYFNAEYIYETSTQPEGLYPFDFAAISNHPAQLGIAAVRADTGETVHWTRADIPDLPSLVRRVRASSTMPILMPMPLINGVPYVDGALGQSGGIPIDQAHNAGFDRLVVVRSRPRGFRRKPPKYPGIFSRVLRNYPEVARLVRTRHERYNATAESIEELESEGKAFVFYPDNMRIGNSERNLAKLEANFAAGEQQVARDFPTLREFIQG
ncbi:MAG: patatin family protein [Corynebacterium sp.]|nr:patatin family protein [Corynebacterium sp.]